MGHVQKRGDRKYRARYVDPDGRERSRTFARKIDAERFLATIESDKLRGAYVDTSHRTTVAAYARAWAQARPHRPLTVKRTTSLIEVHIASTRLGSRRLADVRPSEVQAWATDRAQILAPTTLRRLVTLLGSVYKAAVRDRLVASSPVLGVSLPRSESERIVPLAVDEVLALADKMPPRCRAMVLTQAGLGLRVAELLALRVADVDFLRRNVRVEAQLSLDGRHRLPPKTPRSRRTLPLPDVVATALAQHISCYPAPPEGLVFTQESGLGYRQDSYQRILSKAVRRAGLSQGTTSHDLRHHYASVLLAAGESVIAVAERLGHENATLVLTTYGHLMPDNEDRTRRAVDAAYSTATTDGPQTAFDHG